jgi:hypothetical protein
VAAAEGRERYHCGMSRERSDDEHKIPKVEVLGDGRAPRICSMATAAHAPELARFEIARELEPEIGTERLKALPGKKPRARRVMRAEELQEPLELARLQGLLRESKGVG